MDARNPDAAGELKVYVTGLVLALVLTAIPFALVAFKMLPVGPTLGLVAVTAIIQVLVHFRYFLHMDFKNTSPDWLASLALAVVLLFIMAGGTLWVMFDLNMRMM